MNMYVIEAHRLTPDNTLVKEMQYVVAGSLCRALDWAMRTGTTEAEIVGIRFACPVVAIVPDAEAQEPPKVQEG